MPFEPIAIIGQACLFPGALNPEQLWDLVLKTEDVLSEVPDGYWRIDPQMVMAASPQDASGRTWCNRGGYVREFETIFDPHGFLLPADEIMLFDPLVQWVLHTGREALKQAVCIGGARLKIGAIFGNLSYPSHSLNQFSESVWLAGLGPGFLNGRSHERAGPFAPGTINRFCSGLPAHILARALGLNAGAFALDAACASSLYAIKLACDQLHDRRADIMLAGGVNRADDLIIHIGFCLLQAMSRSSRSLPFTRDADGLVPSEGVGFVALKRLDDAVGAGDRILGVIRAVGLSNDGRGQGLLVPSEMGQELAIRQAYAMSGLTPADISLVEGHATGTPVGDRTEIRSMSKVFGGLTDIPIGTIKSNMGHSITASGIAGLIKVLGAMKAGIRPPTLNAQRPMKELKDSPFRLLTEPEAWTGPSRRRAVINNFGFGGNNAHLIVEEWNGSCGHMKVKSVHVPRTDIAVVGMGAIAAAAAGTDDFAHALFSGASCLRRQAGAGPAGFADPFELPLLGLPFSPADLDQALAQQLLVFKVAMDALAEVENLPEDSTGVLVGMGCDPEAARLGMCWRLPQYIRQWSQDAPIAHSKQWLTRMQDRICPARKAGSVIGAMPNIVANRINSQFDLAGPGFTVSSEELSGLRCLDMAIRALRTQEMDAAVVGAVDLCCEPVHTAAAGQVLDGERRIPGDAAVVLVLKRVEDARRDHDKIYALFSDERRREPDLRLGLADGHLSLTPLFGHAHAASGLVHVAAAVLACHHRTLPAGQGAAARPWLTSQGPMSVVVSVHALGGQTGSIQLVEDTKAEHHPPTARGIHVPQKPLEGSFQHAVRPYAPHPRKIELPPVISTQEMAPVRTFAKHTVLDTIIAQHVGISSHHRDFLARQANVHQQFLAARRHALNVLLHAVEPQSFSADTGLSDPAAPPQFLRPDGQTRAPDPEAMPPTKQIPESPAGKPVGPAFSYAQLQILGSGKISEVFGPLFEKQNGYLRQVRLPQPPLLLTHRVTGLDAEPGSMGKGVIWTETDVENDAWYIHDGYMPPGIAVEAGQSDLVLISYLGVDFLNKSERVYRLLGCDLTYFGSPPRVGDTLCYEIHVDGHAHVGNVRIFFFHYDCRIDGELRLSVRNAQAGFFSDRELADSKGVLWDPETAEIKPDARLDPPAVTCRRNAFSVDQVRAFSEGRVYECFGPGFEIAQTHSRTPKIQSGQMLLIDRVTRFDPKAGPWRRGYLRVENRIRPDAWYLTCHFKNDPCMPGTLMSDACLQAMALYMTAMGYTLDKDGWRFEPVPEQIYHIQCRGQVIPDSRQLNYEVFVEEIIGSPYPTVYADILGTCDGLKILHIRRMGLRLVPGWPLDCRPELLEGYVERRPVAGAGGVQFGYKAMLACAIGRPSDAFGELGRPFDSGRHIPRLPAPPYHFMTRISRIEAAMGTIRSNETIEAEYDIPADAWYFDENGSRTMPFCILMEAALQPCGWMAAFQGAAHSSSNALYFRNLDGTGAMTAEIHPETGTLRTRTTLTKFSRISDVLLINFDVTCFAGEKTVYEMKTGFGFFSKNALDQQAGLPATTRDRQWLDEPCDFLVDLTCRPEKYFAGQLRLPKPMLLMLDRVTGYWPQGGGQRLARLRAEKRVNAGEWFFKAHFFQDPVQPGSLGVESIIQLLQFYMLHENMHAGINHPRFTPISYNTPVTWKYRGQVTPDKNRIRVEMTILKQDRDAQGPYAVAEAWLWVDDLRIFHIKDLQVHIVEDRMSSKGRVASDRVVSAADPCSLPGLPIDEQVAHQLRVPPSTVSLSRDIKTAFCTSMPLNLLPLTILEDKDGTPCVEVGRSILDFERIFADTRRWLGLESWFGEDCARGLFDLFTRYLILEDPGSLENIRDRSVLFLANHQVQVESVLFPLLAQVLTGPRIVTIANATHRTGWMRPFNEILCACPGVAPSGNVVYFDQSNRKSMFAILEGLKTRVAGEGISVFLHVEGKLGLSCRNPVKNLSSVFVDLALEADLPVVPVRFTGGLPVEPMKTTLDFPVGYGLQDYYMGRPILPSELRTLPYAERRNYIIDAINRLGPVNSEEIPNPPNPTFGNQVKTWMARTGATETQAVMLKTVEALEGTATPQTRALIQAAHGDGDRCGLADDGRDRWLLQMSGLLFGQHNQ